MNITVSPSQSGAMKAMGDFLVKILPAGVEIIQGYDNRVPEPIAQDFVVMMPIMRQRLSTNIDMFVDTCFTASVAGTQMTVSALAYGSIRLGATLFGIGVASGTIISSFGTGTGGTGTYTLSVDQGTIAAEKMASGEEQILQPIAQAIQCDVHGPNSAEYSQRISTLFRDSYACEFFAVAAPNIAPLFTDDPKLIPYDNENQQIEIRWAVSCTMQINELLAGIPQEFADQLEVTTIEVEAEYPAS
jgi:hypothetical protein